MKLSQNVTGKHRYRVLHYFRFEKVGVVERLSTGLVYPQQRGVESMCLLQLSLSVWDGGGLLLALLPKANRKFECWRVLPPSSRCFFESRWRAAAVRGGCNAFKWRPPITGKPIIIYRIRNIAFCWSGPSSDILASRYNCAPRKWTSLQFFIARTIACSIFVCGFL